MKRSWNHEISNRNEIENSKNHKFSCNKKPTSSFSGVRQVGRHLKSIEKVQNLGPKHFYEPIKIKVREAITEMTSNFVVICEIPSRKNPY